MQRGFQSTPVVSAEGAARCRLFSRSSCPLLSSLSSASPLIQVSHPFFSSFPPYSPLSATIAFLPPQ